MADQYHIDTHKYSLAKFKDNIQSRDMIPSRVILKEDVDERFEILERSGIHNLKDLIGALNTRTKIENFSNQTGLSIEYLTILKREANSYLPSPVRLSAFSGIPGEFVEVLEAHGIKNSRQLFNQAQDRAERSHLAQSTNIPIGTLDELVCLSDLARAYGVGPAFARMLYDVGITSIKEFAGYTAEEIIEIYESAEKKKADFSVDDIQFSLEVAQALDIAVDI